MTSKFRLQMNPTRNFYQKVNPVRDEQARREWKASKPQFCYICGHDGFGWQRWMEVHHICKFRRSDEPCNFFLVCAMDHMVIEGRVVIANGNRLPPIEMEHVLWVKKHRDPAEYDRARLTQLYGQRLPTMRRPPKYYFDEYARNRGHG